MVPLSMVYGFVVPLSAAFVALIIVSVYRFYRKKVCYFDTELVNK